MTLDTAALRAARKPRKLAWLPVIILVIGIPASVLLFGEMREAVETVAQLRFERQAGDARGIIEARVHSYAEILYALRALFSTHENVSRAQFRNFVAGMNLKDRYPGFDSVNFAQSVRQEDARVFEEQVRRDTSIDPRGYPDFVIKPPGVRPEYYVLVYLEPMRGYEFAFGRDLGASPAVPDPDAVAAALRSSRDTGKLAASGMPIRIKTAEGEYTGLAMRLAVYRPGMPLETVADRRVAYIGSVGAGFNVQRLMRGALDDQTLRHIAFALYDVGSSNGELQPAEPTKSRFLFDSSQLGPAGGAPVDSKRNRMFSRVLPLVVGGRVWEIHFTARRDEVIDSIDALLPWVVLIGGVLSSLLLSSLFYSLASSRSRAEKIANDMTKHLRESEASLAEAHALLSDAQKLAGVGCCQYNPVSGRVVWSEELYRIHGVDARTFTPSYDTAMALVHSDDREAWDRVLSNALASGEPFTAEFRIVRPDGAVRHVRSLGEVMTDAAGRPLEVLWSVLDITEQKETEHVLRSSADQLTALSHRLVEIQENERRQLSRELHDRIGQNLTALSINLDILGSTLSDGRHAEQRARLNDSSALLESTVDSIENVMAELRPPMLDDYGLPPALHWYAKDFSKRTGIEVSVTGNESAERIAPDVEIALFRIAQEALTNVAKHAGATRVDIVLEHSNSRCVMTVTDNGIGVERGKPDTTRHGLGMVTMRERSQAVGGRFSVRTVAGGGAQVAITIP